MWVILPVKSLHDAKLRLADVLNKQQRIKLSRLMFTDVLHTLESCDLVQGVTVISSDISLMQYIAHEKSEFYLETKDNGYSEDAMTAVKMLDSQTIKQVLIIPTDIPQLSSADLALLAKTHTGGITLCPASEDGGTNAIMYSPPLPVPLLFGPDSYNKYCQAAAQRGVKVVTVNVSGLRRDIDRMADVNWLAQQPEGNKTWEFSRDLFQEYA